MGQKLYTQTEGGIAFRTERRIGDVRIPNYVYDLWLPLLGATGLGVYAVYCRLERGNSVKAITMADIAKACRIGTDKLRTINDSLSECGFIEIKKPQGQARLMHWTTEIVVRDAPRQVTQELIEKYALDYAILTPWLLSENLDPTSVELEMDIPSEAEQTPKIESLEVLQPLIVEQAAPPPTFQDWLQSIRGNKNQPATLMRMIGILFPDRPLPDFGYLGVVARRLGAERLAEILWQASTRPPVGDVLAYAQAVAKGKKNGGEVVADRRNADLPSEETRRAFIADRKKRGIDAFGGTGKPANAGGEIVPAMPGVRLDPGG